jgi:oligopeptide transport system substrate-binding protein
MEKMKFIQQILVFLSLNALGKEKEISFNIGLEREPTAWNAQAVYESTGIGLVSHLHVRLYNYDAPPERNLYLEGAEKHLISDDGKTHTFKLRKLTWRTPTGEIKPLKAEHWVKGFQFFIEPKNAFNQAYLMIDAGILGAEEILAGRQPLEALGIKALDDQTLVIQVKQNTPMFKEVLAHPCFAPLYEDKPQVNNPFSLACSGPFCPSKKESVNSSHVTLVKRKEFYQAKQIKVDKIKVTLISNEERSKINAFLSGQIDIIQVDSEEGLKRLKNSNFKSNNRGKVIRYLEFNQRPQSLFQNEELRKAFQTIFNEKAKKRLAQIYRPGLSKPAHRLIPSQIKTSNLEKPYTDTFPIEPYKAKKSLEEILEKAKFELNINSFPTFQLLVRDDYQLIHFAEGIKSILNESNLEAKIEILPFGPYYEKALSGKNWDLLISSWTPDYSHPSSYLIFNNSIPNFGMYQNRNFKLATQLARQSSGRQSLHLTVAAEMELLKTFGIIPLLEISHPYLFRQSEWSHPYLSLTEIPFDFRFVQKKQDNLLSQRKP